LNASARQQVAFEEGTNMSKMQVGCTHLKPATNSSTVSVQAGKRTSTQEIEKEVGGGGGWQKQAEERAHVTSSM
jgi:hypothetical protein